MNTFHYVVTTTSNGIKFWLRGVTWVADPLQADLFAGLTVASEAGAKAYKFVSPGQRAAVLIELTNGGAE